MVGRSNFKITIGLKLPKKDHWQLKALFGFDFFISVNPVDENRDLYQVTFFPKLNDAQANFLSEFTVK